MQVPRKSHVLLTLWGLVQQRNRQTSWSAPNGTPGRFVMDNGYAQDMLQATDVIKRDL